MTKPRHPLRTDPAVFDQAKRMFFGGRTHAKIAEHFGCSVSLVENVLRAGGVTRTARMVMGVKNTCHKFCPVRDDPAVRSKAAELYRSGMTLFEVMNVICCSSNHLIAALHAEGVVTDGKGRYDRSTYKSGTRDLLGIWKGILQRCHPTKGHRRYGRRGIRVCRGWRDSYYSFRADMGPRPEGRYSCDRVNTSGNYSCGHCEECCKNRWPMNCRWATPIEQANNKENNLRFRAPDGNLYTITELAYQAGLRRKTVWQRLVILGWDVDRTISTPSRCPGRWQMA